MRSDYELLGHGGLVFLGLITFFSPGICDYRPMVYRSAPSEVRYVKSLEGTVFPTTQVNNGKGCFKCHCHDSEEKMRKLVETRRREGRGDESHPEPVYESE